MIHDRFRAVFAKGRDNDVASEARRSAAPRNFGLRKFVPAFLITTALFGAVPAVAEASPAPVTMTISSSVFPTGAVVPGALSGAVPVTGGSPVTLTAPEYVYEPSTPPGTLGTVYEFMFWDVNSSLIDTATAKFTAPASGSSFSAGAWYLPVCVVSSSCSGGGPTAVTTWAFSLTNDKVLPGTPISSVSPASAWTSPSTSVSTASAVEIDALPFLGLHSKLSGTEFSSWFVFGGGSASGLDLSVPAGESPYAIAFYTQYSVHIPPIHCVGYPHCI